MLRIRGFFAPADGGDHSRTVIAAVHSGALALVGLTLLGLFFVLAAVNRHRAGRSLWPDRRHPERLAIRLSPEHVVHVVEVEGRRWLVGTGPGAAPSLIAELEPSSNAAASLRAVADSSREVG